MSCNFDDDFCGLIPNENMVRGSSFGNYTVEFDLNTYPERQTSILDTDPTIA